MYNGFILSAVILTTLLFLGVMLSFLTSLILVPIFFTPKKSLKKIVDQMNLQDGEVLYDLGSGDGRVIFEAKKIADIKGVGYEVSPILVLLANFIKKIRFPFDKGITFEVASIFDVKLEQADKIYCHLSQKAMDIISNKFEKQLSGSNTLVYSWRYPITGRKPTKTIAIDGTSNLFIYKY